MSGMVLLQKLAIVSALVVSCLAPASAGSTSVAVEPAPMVICREARETPVIDGRPSEECWSRGDWVAGFLAGEGRGLAKRQTRICLLYTRTHLYLAAECEEPQMDRIKATEPEMPWRDDSLEILLDPSRNRRGYLQFVVTAAGARKAFVHAVAGEMPAWPEPARWESAAAKGSGEWTVEVAIPWTELGVVPRPGLALRANFARNQQPIPEKSSWTPRHVAGSSQVVQFGDVVLEGPAIAAVAEAQDARMFPDGVLSVRWRLSNPSSSRITLSPAVAVAPSLRIPPVRLREVTLEPGDIRILRSEIRVPANVTRCSLDVSARAGSGREPRLLRSFLVSLPPWRPAPTGRVLAGTEWASIWEASATCKVLPGDSAPKQRGDAVRISAARNDFEPYQIVITPGRDLKSLRVRVGDLRGPGVLSSSDVTVRVAETVPVTIPSSVDVTAGDYPDPLVPFDTLSLSAGRSTGIWFTVRVPEDARPGTYRGDVTFEADDAPSVRVPVELRVYDFALPKLPFLRTAYGTWHGRDALCRWHGVPDDEGILRIEELLNRNFFEHRVAPFNPFQSQDLIVSREDGKVSIDFSQFDAGAEKYLPMFNSFMLPGSFMRGVAGVGAGEEGYERLKTQFLQLVAGHLREKGWFDKGYNYIFDEPDEPKYAELAAEAALWHKADSGYRILLTEQVEDGLVGAVDIWTPVLDAYNAARCRDRQQAGDDVWWYVCTGPKHPFPNKFVDYPAIDQRIFHWMTYAWDVSGVLYWETMFWSGNPYEEPMSFSWDERRKPFGNGDGFLLYPATRQKSPEPVVSGPVDSIRWEMIREGVEDYDIFSMLADAVRDAKGAGRSAKAVRRAERALDDVRALCPSLVEYETDPWVLYRVREQAALALESLLKESGAAAENSGR